MVILKTVLERSKKYATLLFLSDFVTLLVSEIPLQNKFVFFFSKKFGIYHVDFNDPDRQRTVKKSAEFYKNVINDRCLPESYVE